VREFSLYLGDNLKNGIKPDARVGLNKPLLERCMNMRPYDSGLIQQPIVINPFGATPTVETDWPFPQLFRGSSVSLLAAETAVYTVDETGDPWDETQITTYDIEDPEKEKAITAGGTWHFADFFDTWMLFNGSCTVIASNLLGMRGESNKVLVADAPAINAGCSFKGRAVYGGFSDGFFTEDWQSIFERYSNAISQDLQLSLSLSSNFIVWTAAGGGDLVWPMIPFSALNSYFPDSEYSVQNPFYIEYLLRGDAGFLPIPLQGTILAIKPLGNGIAVYSENGVSILGYMIDPVPTFGILRTMGVEILGRGSIAGDENGHLFMDRAGNLWKLLADGHLSRLGYKNQFSAMLAEDVLISKSDEEGLFYISSGTDSFILSSKGLSRSSQRLTSVYYHDGGNIGIDVPLVDSEENSFLVTTCPFDMRSGAIKTIQTVRIFAVGLTSVQIQVSYSYDGLNWATTTWRDVNTEGVATIFISGLQFKISIKGITSTDAVLDDIQVSWKATDKRTVRSGHANPAAA